MYSLILAVVIVSQTPDFGSLPRVAMNDFSSVSVSAQNEVPPTAEIEERDCLCGGNCKCLNCKTNMARVLGLEEEVKRLTGENLQLRRLPIQERKPIATIGDEPKYWLKDLWGYDWWDYDKQNLINYVNQLNSGNAGHPHYNEIILRHQPKVETPVYSLPQTYSFDSAGSCAGGSCSRSLFGGFR